MVDVFSAVERAHDNALRMARQEAERVAEIVSLGVTLSTDSVHPEANGCSSCLWHAINIVESREDGGTAAAILSWIKEGYLGDPSNIVLHPVKNTPRSSDEV